MINASGHFSTPNVPEFPGLAAFPGRVLHSHDFRSADEFAGKDVLCIGASYSSEDIGIQCHKYGAKSVTFSYRTRPMGFNWPESMSEVPLLVKVEGKTAYFKDGTSKDVDAIVLCTGYLHHYPFLMTACASSRATASIRRLSTRACSGGRTTSSCTSARRTSTTPSTCSTRRPGTLATSSSAASNSRASKSRPRTSTPGSQREEAIADAFEAIDFQTEYVRDLLGPTDYPRLDVDMVARLFKEWEHHKMENILTYRDRSYPSTLTGNVAPVHHTPWMQALDDSMQAFLNQPDPAAAKVA